jgi:hypothetical protein
MLACYFEIRRAGRAGVYQHLALFAANAPAHSAPLAQWLLLTEPALPGPDMTLLLTEVPAATPLPALLTDAGPGTVAGTTLPVATVFSSLTLELRGQELRGCFLLQRLQPGGTTWLLCAPPVPLRPGAQLPAPRLPAGRPARRAAVYTQR